MNRILLFFLVTVVALIVDILWITKLSGGIYTSGMGHLARMDADGKMQPILWSALIVYILIPLAVTVFILGDVEKKTYIETIGMGALLGFCIYGVYDFTNYATLRDLPLKMILIDVAWGTFLCGFLSAVGKLIVQYFTKTAA